MGHTNTDPTIDLIPATTGTRHAKLGPNQVDKPTAGHFLKDLCLETDRSG
jgi:hypothetical protein